MIEENWISGSKLTIAYTYLFLLYTYSALHSLQKANNILFLHWRAIKNPHAKCLKKSKYLLNHTSQLPEVKIILETNEVASEKPRLNPIGHDELGRRVRRVIKMILNVAYHYICMLKLVNHGLFYHTIRQLLLCTYVCF